MKQHEYDRVLDATHADYEKYDAKPDLDLWRMLGSKHLHALIVTG